jgi:hypothetical protein
MGRYVNPTNEGFARILADEYVDKTGLVALFDSTLDTTRGLVMVSRPRRFGKSYAAQAVSAFYSCGCDSRALFEGLEVSRREGWDEHLNAYNVVRLDMTAVMQAAVDQHLLRRRIGIAVSAQVSAGIISTDIAGQVAGTGFPGIGPFRHDQPLADRLFIIRDLHAASAVRPIGCQLIAFRTGTYDHTMLSCDLDHGLA